MKASRAAAPAPTFRSELEDELAERCARNARYSLRAFARDLGWSPPRLSMVMRGKVGLSRDAAQDIGMRLGWSSERTNRFCDLVESAHARSPKRRKSAAKRVESNISYFSSLDLSRFRLVADWHHNAIMELTETADFRSDEGEVARRLGISPHEARAAVRRLFDAGMLHEVDGHWKITGNYFVNAEGVPSEAARLHHAQLLEKAREALTFQTTQERKFSAVTLAIDPEDLGWVEAEIAKFRESIVKRLDQGRKKKKVYQFAIQFYGLEKKEIR